MDSTKLIHRYLLGEASEEEVRQLDRLLAEDADLRRKLIFEASADAGLREIALERVSDSAPIEERMFRLNFQKMAWPIAAVLVLGVFVMFKQSNKQPEAIATLVSSENAAWESSLPTTPNSDLIPGLLNLKAGMATIEFHSGATVLLEAPASLELQNSMRGKLISGAAVIDVPEQAIGFVIDTPSGFAVDHGTQFAVVVDGAKDQSNFEVIDGEISVHLPSTGEQARLQGQGQAATLSADTLITFDALQENDLPDASPRVVRLGTQGRSTTVLRNNRRQRLDAHLLTVKTTQKSSWDHRSLIGFDVSKVDLDSVESVKLRLNMVPRGFGFVSRLPKINRFGIYGVASTTKSNWEIESLWEDAPGPEDGILLDTFEVPRSQQRGSFQIGNEKVLEFLRAHREVEVTFVIVRETSESSGESPGLAHAFATDLHPEAAGPSLEFTFSK